MGDEIKLDPSWKEKLGDEFAKPYMAKLKGFLQEQYLASKVIYPRGSDYFNALNSTPFQDVRAVIVGQDPYHGPGQAHGLCFSVPPGVVLPPSLKNIFSELSTDLGLNRPQSGCLLPWAKQGVLLLNSVLTVERNLAGSHANRGWETFTDRVIQLLNEREAPLAFILWGAYAQRKGMLVDAKKHLVITAPHPSPLSAHRGFFGSRPFSQVNAFLRGQGLPVIDWALPN